MGYTGMFLQKCLGMEDGIATFFKTNMFELASVKEEVLSNLIESLGCSTKRFPQVLLLVGLRHLKTGSLLAVGEEIYTCALADAGWEGGVGLGGCNPPLLPWASLRKAKTGRNMYLIRCELVATPLKQKPESVSNVFTISYTSFTLWTPVIPNHRSSKFLGTVMLTA